MWKWEMHERFPLSHCSSLILQIQRDLLSFQKRSIASDCAAEPQMRNDWSMADADGVLSARIESQTPISTLAQLGSSQQRTDEICTIGSLVHKRCSINSHISPFQTKNASRMLLCSQLFQPDFLWHILQDMTCLMCWMLAQSNQNNQIKQLSSKHVSTSGMMNQLTFHSGFTTLLMLNLLH